MRKLPTILSDKYPSSSPLNSLREQYVQGLLNRKDFEECIFRFLLDNYRQFKLFHQKQDKFLDYLCWLYPQLSRAIDTYKETGSSFDAYIFSIVRSSGRLHYTREIEHSVTEYACWEARAEEELLASENTPAYLDEEERLKPVRNPRQVLILLLKSYFFVSDSLAARAAPAIGVSIEQLTAMLDKLRELRREQDQKISWLRYQVDRQYYRCVSYRKQFEALPEYTSKKEYLGKCLERASSKYTRIKKRLGSANFEPSNRQIAEVLGIPKGTVDATLYTLKQKFKCGQDKALD